MATAPQAERLLRHAREYGFVRPRDLDRLRVPRTILKRLVDAGLLVRRSRGVYTVPEYEPTEHTDLAAVAKRAPKAIICLLSALRFHELTTQNPFDIWIMIGQTAWRPQIEHPPVRVIRASGAALTEGVDVHEIEGIDVRITAPAKTVADCFKYRGKVGVDVAVEALREYSRRHRGGATELARFAEVCRVTRVMQPYLDSTA